MSRNPLLPFVAIATALSFGLVSCGQEDPPTLPSEDSMVLPDFDTATGGALTLQAANTNNVAFARLSVGLVTLGVQLALVTPRVLFAGAINTKPTLDGGTWIWEKNYPLLGYETALHGKLDGALHLEMHVSKVAGDVQFSDFVWYDGDHHAKDGIWRFYELDNPDPVLTIDWARASDTDKDLVFTYVKAGTDENGDSIAYSLKGTTASMTLHDAINGDGVEATFTVEWSTADGSGMMTAPDLSTYCWDTAANGYVDIPCP